MIPEDPAAVLQPLRPGLPTSEIPQFKSMTTKTPALTPHAATVEMLTAEVRVLMVGSRQITLSVFRQLDWVPQAKCEVMGRINDGDADAHLLIGRHRDTGILVRSFVERISCRRLNYQEQQELARLRHAAEIPPAPPAALFQRLRELEEIAREDAKGLEQWRAIVAAYDALPLIVLAGLR